MKFNKHQSSSSCLVKKSHNLRNSYPFRYHTNRTINIRLTKLWEYQTLGPYGLKEYGVLRMHGTKTGHIGLWEYAKVGVCGRGKCNVLKFRALGLEI